MKADNFAFVLLSKALACRDKPAFVTSESTVTYGRFADLTIHFANRMSEAGVSQDSIIGLATNSQLVGAVATSAVALLGASWMALPAAQFPGNLAATFVSPSAARPGQRVFDGSWFDAPAADLTSLDRFPGYRELGDTWMFASSSGTTGSTKYMPLSYGLAWQRMAVLESEDGLEAKIAILFPALSYVCTRIHIGNLIDGGTNVAPEWGRMTESSVDRVIGSPAQFAARVFNREPPIRRLRSCKVTGARVSDSFVANAMRYFEEVQVLYGATEAGVVALGRFTDRSPYDGSVGRVHHDVRLEVLDSDGRPCAAGAHGQIRISSAWVVPGYYKRPDLNAQFFRDGWFYPQDIGVVDDAGRLRIVGRSSDIINNGGSKINAADLDDLIQASPAVADGFCFTEENTVGVQVISALVKLKPDHDVSELLDINLIVDRRLGKKGRLFCLYVAPEIPRNANGKALRSNALQLVPTLKPTNLH